MTEKEFLNSYDPNKYERLSVSVDSIVFTIRDEKTDDYRKLPVKKLQVLLIKRQQHPFINKWAIPGAFAKKAETFEEAVNRGLNEKANINNIYLEQLYSWGNPKRDERTRIISVSYMGLINSDNISIKPGDKVNDISWFTISNKVINDEIKEKTEYGYRIRQIIELNLTNNKETINNKLEIIKEHRRNKVDTKIKIIESELAFDHAKQLIYAIERLKNKVEYTTIAFNLMPEKFALTKLQQVYEILLEKKLLKASFRRKILPMVVETDEFDETLGHRPSKLYMFNDNYKEKNFKVRRKNERRRKEKRDKKSKRGRDKKS